MNITFYEKHLTPSVINAVSDLALFRQRRGSIKKGIIYTALESKSSLCNIGFCTSHLELEALSQDKNFKLIDQRYGNERELRLLKLTLNEIGHKPISIKDSYYYPIHIIKVLNMLGWPIGNLKRSYIKKLN